MKFDSLRYCVVNTIIFIFLVPIGTFFHELGHYFVALFLNLSPQLHFNYVEIALISENKISDINVFCFALGGPLATITVSFIGFIGCLKKWKPIQIYPYLTLFASREIYICIMSLFFYFLGKSEKLFGGDEYFINSYLNIPTGIIPILFGLLGLFFCLYTISFIEKEKRFLFILSGCIGCIVGYLIFMF